MKAICLYITLHESLEERDNVNVNCFYFKTLRTEVNSRGRCGQSWPDRPSLQPDAGPSDLTMFAVLASFLLLCTRSSFLAQDLLE